MIRTMAQVSRSARPYPAYLLNQARTGLCVFSAAFHGHNDAVHFARNGVVTTCVDVDQGRLDDMQKVYPSSWTFVCEDAWDFALENRGRQWDVVSVDPFFGDAAARVWATLDLFLSLARSTVTVTVPDFWDAPAPKGWTQSLFDRSDKASWLVLQRV